MRTTKGSTMTKQEAQMLTALITANQTIAWQRSVIEQLKAQLPDDLETVRPGLGQFDDDIHRLTERAIDGIAAAVDAGLDLTPEPQYPTAGLFELLWKTVIRPSRFDRETLKKIPKKP